jgi:hypothetical protein
MAVRQPTIGIAFMQVPQQDIYATYNSDDIELTCWVTLGVIKVLLHLGCTASFVLAGPLIKTSEIHEIP